MGAEVHKYTWQGGKLIAEQYGDTELEFFYDESGAPYAFCYKAGANATEQVFYYVTNLQGDVMQILDASGNTAASYTYNAWGKILNLNNSTSANIGDLNPIRYRGYYYDTETGLYYLKSRYYAPEICRFINADGLASTGQGFLGTNMFAYGLNGPVEDADSEGTSTRIVIEVVAGIVRDLYQIFRKDGNQVRVDDNGDGTLKIVNSSSVHTPIVQFGYSVYINLFNEHNHLIDGTSTGVFFEWIVHNVIYDMAMTLEQFGVKNASLDRIKESAHDADIGRTIFEGKRAGDKAMQLAYALSCPIQANIDYFISRIIQ